MNNMMGVICNAVILAVFLLHYTCAFKVFPIHTSGSTILTSIGQSQRLKIAYNSPTLSLHSATETNFGYLPESHSRKQEFEREIKDIAKNSVFSLGKFPSLAVLFPAWIVSLFTPNPVLAAIASSTVPKVDRAKLESLRGAHIRKLPKWTRKVFRLTRKLLFGSKSSTSNLASVVDNRSQIVRKSLVRSLAIMVLFAAFSVTLLKWEDVYQTIRLKREIGREMQYRESMFFDAVEDIVKKIEDPKVKSAMKDGLKKELRDLDPKGEIQAFLKGKGPRPDLSQRISESMKKKAAEKRKVEEAARAKMERLRQKEIQDGMARMRAEEEVLEAERRRNKLQEDIRRKQNERNAVAGTTSRNSGPQSDDGTMKRVDLTGSNRENDKNIDNEDEEDEDDNYLEEEDEDEGDDEDDSDNNFVIEDLQQPELIDLGTKIFQKLNKELSAVLTPDDRRLLLQQLLNRLVSLSDATHQKAALQNIGQRVSNMDYWQAYLENLKSGIAS